MKTTTIVGLALAILAACGGDGGGDGPPGPGGKCTAPTGLYRMHWDKTSGTCGDLPDSIVNTDNPDDVGACKRYNTSVSDTGCETTLDADCMDDSGGRIKYVGKLTSNSDGTRATGDLYFDAAAASGETCTGIYRVTYSKL